jgi:DNA-binding NarL/FixJ family response regulator
MDVSMPEVSGIRAAEDVRRSSLTVKLLALTRHTEHGYLQQMLQAGVTGYALKQTAAETLLDAIRTVARGGTYLDSALAPKIAQSLSRRSSSSKSAARSLTYREQQVVTMVVQGYTNKETSASLGITVKTVESHKAKIMQKLGINSRAELVRFAILQGWLDNSSA